MSNKDNGGPAFPCEGGRKVARGSEIYKTLPSDGMTMRDYFAAKYLQGFIANSNPSDQYVEIQRVDLARLAYLMADAMLEARNQ